MRSRAQHVARPVHITCAIPFNISHLHIRRASRMCTQTPRRDPAAAASHSSRDSQLQTKRERETNRYCGTDILLGKIHVFIYLGPRRIIIYLKPLDPKATRERERERGSGIDG